MGRYILRRILVSIPVLFGITLVTYLIVSLAPGDPVSALISPEQISELGPGWLEQQRAELGLDKPLPVRYGLWMKEIVQGNLGFSYTDRQPVADKISERIWPTVKLMLTVQIMALMVAVPIGIISAIRQYSLIDYLVTIFGFATISIPAFFLALAAIYVFAIKLQWLPAAGMATLGQPPSYADSIKHLILPATVLGLGQAAPLIRYTRSSMLETIRQDYVRVARAKGLSERAVISRHALAQCPDSAGHGCGTHPAAVARRHRDHRADICLAGNGVAGDQGRSRARLPDDHGHQHDRRSGDSGQQSDRRYSLRVDRSAHFV